MVEDLNLKNESVNYDNIVLRFFLTFSRYGKKLMALRCVNLYMSCLVLLFFSSISYVIRPLIRQIDGWVDLTVCLVLW